MWNTPKISKRLRYDKLRRHFKHTRAGIWVTKNDYVPKVVNCCVCEIPFSTYYLEFEDCESNLKRIYPGTTMLVVCSPQCNNVYATNPLAYE